MLPGEGTTGNYGAVGRVIGPVLQRAETQAKKRAVYFLIVFMVSGVFSECIAIVPAVAKFDTLSLSHSLKDLLLCVELLLLDTRRYIEGEPMSPSVSDPQKWTHKLYYVTLCLQVNKYCRFL